MERANVKPVTAVATLRMVLACRPGMRIIPSAATNGARTNRLKTSSSASATHPPSASPR